MAIAVGEIVEGKVTGLTKFGAFVALPEDKVGMVHISEVSSSFVKDIAEFLEKGQEVKVKILNIDENGKISLSIKRAQDDNGESSEGERPTRKQGYKKDYNKQGRESRPDGDGQTDAPREKKNYNRSQPNVWQGQKTSTKSTGDSFEDMMAKFKQQSDDKLSDLKRATESKHGGYSRRGGNKKY